MTPITYFIKRQIRSVCEAQDYNQLPDHKSGQLYRNDAENPEKVENSKVNHWHVIDWVFDNRYHRSIEGGIYFSSKMIHVKKRKIRKHQTFLKVDLTNGKGFNLIELVNRWIQKINNLMFCLLINIKSIILDNHILHFRVHKK